MVTHPISWRSLMPIATVGILSVCVLGCGRKSEAPLEGVVVIETESDFHFSGDTLEIRSKDRPAKVAYGEIKADGTFRIESLRDGAIVQGTSAGEYEARIVVSDDDSRHKSAALKAIPKKYMQFASSGLKVTAPNKQVTITIFR